MQVSREQGGLLMAWRNRSTPGAVAALALGLAYGAAQLFGLSFALGAFFAGIVIHQSDVSHRAAADLQPLQDLFAALFFVSVGMLFDPGILLEAPVRVLAVLAIIMIGKSLVAFAIVLVLRRGLGTALLVSAALGLLVGAIAIRRQGIYFAMITLALAQMFYFFCLRAEFTGGENGIQGVPRGHLANTYVMYYFVAAVFLLAFAVIFRIIHSPFGQVLKAVRENEPRAISLGYKTDQYKVIAFVLSAGLAGLAGGTKAMVFQLSSLTDVHWGMSGEVILMTLIGGIGTIFGPVVGAVFFVTLENYLAQLGSWVQVVQGVIFVICVIAFRRGIVGELARVLKRPL